ncbi:MAG: hypothetical protein IKT10_03500 [Clostridiales bacterium]|nr:hypothetical protein [Clostridiales bacterium]
MPTDNNEQLELVDQRTRLNVSNVLMSVTITTFLVTGFSMMYSTAFNMEFGVWAIMMFALITALIFTVLYNFNKKWLTAIVVILSCLTPVSMAFFDLFDVQKGLMVFLYNMQMNAFYWLPGVFEGGSPDDSEFVLKFVQAYNLMAVSLTTLALTRRKNIPLTLLLYVPLFVCAVSNTTMLPEVAPSIAAATGVLLAFLAHGFRKKQARQSGFVLFLLTVPVLIFSIIAGVLFPVDTYDKDQLATDILEDLVETAQNISQPISEILDTALHGIRNPNSRGGLDYMCSLYSGSTNLDNVGPFDPPDMEIMKVTKMSVSGYSGPVDTEKRTCLYIKVESFDTYENNNLKGSKIKMPVYDEDKLPETQEAPYAVWIEPIQPAAVDLVPYYTDFYKTYMSESVRVSPYNTTKEDAHIYSVSTVPVKTGDIYTEEYKENYVYKTCLEVPKSTEMAIISSGKLPDWYLDIYHGYVTYPDAQKVKMVTEYVRELHPYSAETDYPPRGVDFVPWFIKDAESGICVHYAATTVILLRLIGVPARYVRGYVDYQSYPDSEHIVYATHSHAWFEFFAPEYGWIMGDSTPGSASNSGDYDINAVIKAYPEFEQASFARGFTSIFNPDYTNPSATSSETEPTDTEPTDTESAATSSETTPDETEPASPTPADQTEPSQSGTTSDEPEETKETKQSEPPSWAVSMAEGMEYSFGPNGEFTLVFMDESAAGKLVKLVRNVVCTLGIIALVIDIFILGWFIYWKRHFKRKSCNSSAISYYHYYDIMGRIFRYHLPKKAVHIAEKAAFAQEKLTPRELEALVAACEKDMNEIAKGFNRYKKILFNALLVKTKDHK